MLVVGLTGGVGSGKSTAAELFARHGAAITDTDSIAHALTLPGQPALDAIRKALGGEYLTPAGELDRARLRRKVFSDASARKALENLLHPLIRQAVASELSRHTASPYCIIVVPLLFETGAYGDLIDRALLVDCPESLQVERVMSRGILTKTEVLAIMSAQSARQERLTLADDIIVNDGDLQKLADQVEVFHKKYLRLA